MRCVILVATDGLFDMVSNERAMDVAFEHFGNPAGTADELVREECGCGREKKRECMGGSMSNRNYRSGRNRMPLQRPDNHQLDSALHTHHTPSFHSVRSRVDEELGTGR